MTNELVQETAELNRPELNLPEPATVPPSETPQQNRPGMLSEAQTEANVIMNVLHVVGSARSAEDAARKAMETIRSTFGWAYGSYWILDDTSNALRLAVESGTVSEEFHQVTTEAPVRGVGGLLRRAWRGRELCFVEDIGVITDCARSQAAKVAGVKSNLCFPIYVQGGVAGVMEFLTLESLSASPERLEVLRYVGRLVSAAVDRLTLNPRPQHPVAEA